MGREQAPARSWGCTKDALRAWEGMASGETVASHVCRRGLVVKHHLEVSPPSACARGEPPAPTLTQHCIFCWGKPGDKQLGAGVPSLPGPIFLARPSPGVSLTGAVRRGSAVGYFNERCQGLQSGEEAEGAAERLLAKLGLGRGGLARRCSTATAALSSPAGTSAPFRIRSQRLFPMLCSSFLSCSSFLRLTAFGCAHWEKGGLGELAWSWWVQSERAACPDLPR